MRKKAAVFGATPSAREDYDEIKKQYDIVVFCDNDSNKWNQNLDGIRIVSPEDIFQYQWDEVIIVSFSAMDAIQKQLIDMGLAQNKINISYVNYKVWAREIFVKHYAQVINAITDKEICVAEAGVFQGEFARVINESFPDRKLYLFDTFEGFDGRDVAYEKEYGFSDAVEGYLNLTSESLILGKMKYRENCVIRKGYFPESAEGVKERFCFVSLDMDLYKPTLEGLRFFYPLMTQGGIILIHDYFSHGYEGINAAVEEFIEETDREIVPFPIGDAVSIAIQKRQL